MTPLEKRAEANKVLTDQQLSDDKKLHQVYQIYKEDIEKQFPQVNYALLGWKDKHLKELNLNKQSYNIDKVKAAMQEYIETLMIDFEEKKGTTGEELELAHEKLIVAQEMWNIMKTGYQK